MRPLGILPVQKAHSAYHVAALNNLYARAVELPPMSAGSPNDQSNNRLAEGDWEARLSSELAGLQGLADEVDGDPEALLLLLRRLEDLHRTIQDGPFRASLPADRGELFNLLQGMERSGGWPYIPRLQLRTFLDLLQSGDDTSALAA
jgi:hypothetical protein